MHRRKFIILMGGAFVAASSISYVGFSDRLASEPEVVKPYGNGFKVVDGWVLRDDEHSIDDVRSAYD